MARYNAGKSNVVFNPTHLRLKSNAHRVSLDANEVAVLSGRDPKEYGSIGRMPGGKAVSTNFPVANSPAYNARFYQRKGVTGGHILKTVLTSQSTGASGTVVFDVASVAGFSVGEWVAVFDPTSATSNAQIGVIISIGSTTLTATVPIGGALTGNIPVGAWVVRCCPTSTAASATDTAYTTRFPMDLQIGMSAKFIGCKEGADSVESIQIVNIAGNVVTFAPPLASNKDGPCVILPDIAAYALSEGFVNQVNGDLYTLKSASFKQIYDASVEGYDDVPRSLALQDRHIFANNGVDRPKRITVHTGTFDESVTGQKPPLESVGFPDPPQNMNAIFDLSGLSSGDMTLGEHGVFARLVDKSVFPYAKSPPLGVLRLTVATTPIRFLPAELFSASAGVMQPNFIGEAYRRATHVQIWVTIAGGGTHILAYEKHLSYYLDSGASGWTTTAATISIRKKDAELLALASRDAKNVLGESDYAKGLMPNGRYVHHAQGITWVGGASDVAADSEYPKITTGNNVHYSRTDADEPENFPPDNFRPVGTIGDDIIGFVDAADSTVILTGSTFSVAKRIGAIINFMDGGEGQGCAHEEAFCKLGDSHAAWVSEKSVWLFDGRTQESPIDIGFDIRDWVDSLSGADRVRMVYDPIERLLYVGKVYGDTIAEAMIYHFSEYEDERGWVKREDMVLDAPFYGRRIESSTSRMALYRFGGSPPKCYRAIDYDSQPTVDGGYPLSTNVMRGTISTNLGSLATFTGLTLASGGSNALRGLVIRFIFGNGSEAIRVINASSTTSVTWTTAITLNGSSSPIKWIIGCIPFRLRFPPIRGQDVFATKQIFGSQMMIDNVDYDGQSADAELTIKLLRNFKTSPDTGGSDTMVLATGVAVRSKDLAAYVQASGEVIEAQVEQLDRHVDFSLLYLGLITKMPGVFGGDRSTTV